MTPLGATDLRKDQAFGDLSWQHVCLGPRCRKNMPLIRRAVDEYESGTSSTRLAARYAVGKGTVLRLIRASCVVIRSRVLARHLVLDNNTV
jgi:hypothetical protein